MKIVSWYILQLVLLLCSVECKLSNDSISIASDNESSESKESKSIEIDSDEQKSFSKIITTSPINKATTQEFQTAAVNYTLGISEKVEEVTEIQKANDFSRKSCSEFDSSSNSYMKCKTSLISYPYTVSIQKKGSHYVSGALIDDRRILSSAGDFYTVRETIKLFKARLGSVNCKKSGILKSIKQIELHALYEPEKPSYDISLITLSNPVTFTDYIQPIDLSRIKADVISAKFLVTYWPRIVDGSTILSKNAKERTKSNSMRVSSQMLIPWDDCYPIVNQTNTALPLSAISLCLEPIESHHSQCRPDPGAPLVANDGLWGITSGWISKDCFKAPSPTICTRISSTEIQCWLDSKLKGNHKKIETNVSYIFKPTPVVQ